MRDIIYQPEHVQYIYIKPIPLRNFETFNSKVKIIVKTLFTLYLMYRTFVSDANNHRYIVFDTKALAYLGGGIWGQRFPQPKI